MASNLRVDTILPSTGTNVAIGTASGSVTFLGDTDISTNGDVTIGGKLGIGGTLTYEDVTNIDSVGVITARSDLSIADKIIHTGDTNTAIRFPAADTITAETGGTERLRIDSSGRVGITSIIPASKFTVKGGSIFVGDNNMHGGSAGVIEYGGNSGHFDLKGYSMGGNTTIRMFTSSGGTNAERLRITSTGRIGIGTDNPGNEVEINGAAQFTSGGDVDGPSMLVFPHPDVTLASNASTTLNFPNRFTGLVVINGKSNDTPAVIYALASASAYSSDGATRLMIQNHPASNISDLTITSPSHGGTYQYQLNQTGSSTKTYKIFAFGIFGS